MNISPPDSVPDWSKQPHSDALLLRGLLRALLGELEDVEQLSRRHARILRGFLRLLAEADTEP